MRQSTPISNAVKEKGQLKTKREKKDKRDKEKEIEQENVFIPELTIEGEQESSDPGAVGESASEASLHTSVINQVSHHQPPTVTEKLTQGHANIELVTFDKLNPYTVETLMQERQRLEYGSLRNRYSLLHQIDRSQWTALFAITQLHGVTPLEWSHDLSEHFQQYRAILQTWEEEVLEMLKKQFPPQKAASVVELCSKAVWRIDPRSPSYLGRCGQVKQKARSAR